MKKHLFYTILAVFIATAILTLLGITNAIVIQPRYLDPLFGALLLELVAVIIGLARGIQLSDDDTGEKSSSIIAAPESIVAELVGSIPCEQLQPSCETSVEVQHAPKPNKLEQHIRTLKERSKSAPPLAKLKDELLMAEASKSRPYEYNRKLEALNGQPVFYTGVVTSVHHEDIYDGACIGTRFGKSPLNVVLVWVPPEAVANAFSLQADDTIEVEGIVEVEAGRIGSSVYTDSVRLSEVTAEPPSVQSSLTQIKP